MIEDWLSFILLSIMAVLFLALIVAKLHSPFWFHQPVYHIYEIYPRISWSRAPYIKRLRPPKVGIFCIPNQIKTVNQLKNLPQFVELLQGHYLDNDTNLYHHTINTIEQVLYNGCYLSGYFETKLVEPTFHKSLNPDVLYGMITSRPVDIFFLSFAGKNLTIHYFDFICVHEKYRTKTISRNLIQTHVYNHMLQDPSFAGAYLFKKEVELCKGIVPLIQSTAYTFMLTTTPLAPLPVNYSIKCLNNKTSIDVWRVLYEQMKKQFEVCVLPNFPNTTDWLTNERYIIYISVYKDKAQEKIHGLYIFEDTYVSYEQDIPCPFMVRLAGSMVFGEGHTHDVNNLYFFRGFLHSLKAIQFDKKKFGVLEIPNVSDNDILLERWQERYELRNETLIGYYLYNMVYPNMPIPSNRFLCLT